MSVGNQMLRRASRLTGVPLWILQRVDRQEGSGTSPAGAKGEFQLMPGTARGLERKYGINTRTTWGNVLGGAYYLKQQFDSFKRWDYALAAYNAGPNAVRHYGGIPPFTETQDYVRKIMHGESPGKDAGTTPLVEPVAGDVAAPASTFTKSDVAQEGLAALASGNYDPTFGVQELVRAAESASSALPNFQSPGFRINTTPASGPWKKWVSLDSGADRAGVSTLPEVLQFVGMIGKRAGRRLVIGTGTQHNQFVVGTHRESDHWTGHAADIPAEGAALTRLGRLALVQAGMPRREAMRVKGGLFNVGRYQIIFNTNEGGNHYNHLHVGVR